MCSYMSHNHRKKMLTLVVSLSFSILNAPTVIGVRVGVGGGHEVSLRFPAKAAKVGESFIGGS